MELHQLRYFHAVAIAGSFTRAAENEHVAQPSLSQQILKLEDELGTRLFDRLGREVRLTPAGKALLLRARSILKSVGDAKQEVQEIAGGHTGAITIGAIPTIAPYFLPQHAARFAKLYPKITLNIVEDLTQVLLDRLHEGLLDMAIVALPVRGSEFRTEEIVREPLLAVVPASHRLARQQTVSLRELEDDRFVLLKEGHCIRDSIVSACKRTRMRLNVALECGQFATVLAMVSTGAGVSIVPAMAAHPHPGCRFLRIADDRAERQIGMVYRNHRLSAAQKLLLEECRKPVRVPHP